MQIIKKDGTLEQYNFEKIKNAVSKSAERVMEKLTTEDWLKIKEKIESQLVSFDTVKISTMHNIVETVLDELFPKVSKSYKDYRNYKQDFVHMLDEVYQKSQSIMYMGDKENSNTDSALVSTKRSLIFNQLNKELYQKFFMTTEELQACRDGYIYIHDMSARRDTMNCCLFNVENVLKGGFEMGNIWYNEPKTLDAAFDVIGDIVLSAASQQYGGFTVPCVDTLLEPYAKKTYNIQYERYKSFGLSDEKAHEEAMKDVTVDFQQGFQGWEYKFNTVASSRGDYPFITVTAGIGRGEFAKLATKTMLSVRKNGQGKKECKKPVLFPKIVFLYDERLHGKGCELEDVFEAGVECSSRSMYPDWLSLTGEGYVADIYKKYGEVISPMGCVDGNEIITYKFHNKLYVESFKRMWKRISEEFKVIGQISHNDTNKMIDLLNSDVMIYDTEKGFTKVKYLIRNLQNDWCNVSISNGRNLKVTLNHPFETENRGVVLAKDLTSKDLIRINTNQYSEKTIKISNEEAWLNGFMLCGGRYQNSSVSVSIAAKGEDDIENFFKYAIEKVFDRPCYTILQRRGKKNVYKHIKLKKDLEPIVEHFTMLFGGLKKNFRHIPNEVFSYDEDAKYSFLAGMIDANGYINANKKHKYSTVKIGSTNKELALQQMALAQSLGMKSKVYINHYPNNTKKVRYRVEFSPNKTLIKHIVCSKKASKYKRFANNVKNIEYGNVLKVEPLSISQYSYDLTTESEHFEVSGVYSHNCRAFLSPYYERGGFEPADENDRPIFTGRFNIGAVSLHLPMIYAKAKQENRDFYEVLDYYLNLIRQVHIRTYEYLGEMKASTNPLAYCEGGFYGGNLSFHDKIKPLLKSATASFGITALNELQQLHNKKSIAEDGKFALEVMEYINKKVSEFKKEDGHLYAIYGTPAESLCGLQVKQFREKYGIVENVSDREYVSNSFHCHVTEDISPIQKQDLENRFWNLANGGKIQYVKYPISYNTEAIKTLIRRAMKMGLYEGVNLSLSYCDDCGHQELDMDICPKCGSRNLTKIDRMNGYLSYSRVKGDTRLNSAKMAEIADRKSM